MVDYAGIIEAYRRALPPNQIVQFPLSGIDRIGVPFQMLTFYPEAGPTNAGSGYGATDDEALMGAYGELTEVVSANLALKRMKLYQGSYHQLAACRPSNSVLIR